MATTVQNTVGALATQAMEAYLRKAEGYEKLVIRDRDPEDLHQMRICLRKLRTAMQVFAPGISLPKAGRETQVAAINRKLGKLRDLDVIAAVLRKQYLPDLSHIERKKLKPVFNYLKRKRKQAYKQAKSMLKGSRYKAFKKSLRRWILEPDCNLTARLNIEVVLPDFTLPLVSHLWLHPGWLVEVRNTEGKLQPDTRLSMDEVDAAITHHSEAIHSLRKQVKRVRYQLKMVAVFYGDRLRDDLSKLTTLQDTLGALQDSLVMEEFLHQALPKWKTQLPTLKSLLTDNRHRAWKQWQTQQQYYLETQNRKALRQRLMEPGIGIAPAEPNGKEPHVTT
ncbi:MAG: CHAD domain-containing protein [Leptolyngbya sp. SIO1D8]|nr:CHAD domain-containing protein [Leptolyngbya sp. SIO1D8]